jgi:hypothetical protein
MTCVLTLLAEFQAAVDQLVGTYETITPNPATDIERLLLEQQIKVARFCQASIDRYEEKHGDTDVSFKVRGARALRQALVA